MLKYIVAVTICVSDLPATEEAFQRDLDYEVVERATVPSDLAELWNTPAMAGRNYIMMQPQSGAEFYLRFIDLEPVEGYAALRTEGWNAVELLVQDPDAVAERLASSSFEIIGQPRDLTGDGMVRAMQARSPAGEVFYLTRIAGERTELYGEAQSFIDRTFIMVVGARDHGALLDFYGTKLGNELTPTSEFPITVLSRAYDFPIETTYELASVRLKDKFSIEMDHYPDEATPRPQRDGELPPGIAMVSFGVESLDDLNLEWRAAPREIEAAPYDGRRSAVAVGPAGEWLEIVEDAD